MVQQKQWLAFRVAEQGFGLDIRCVREIVRLPQITAVPQSPAHIAGVMNLRGQIVPIVDLGKRLGGAPKPPMPGPDSRKSRVLVLTLSAKLTGLLVDEATEVLKIAAADIEPAPKLFGDDGESYVTGIARHQGKLVVLLDAEKLLCKEGAPQPAIA
jgi:purine-binding chemotaxis protein CheW